MWKIQLRKDYAIPEGYGSKADYEWKRGDWVDLLRDPVSRELRTFPTEREALSYMELSFPKAANKWHADSRVVARVKEIK